MANTRNNADSVTKTSASRKPQQRTMPQLFQNTLLTALFGRGVGILVTRVVLFVAVIGVLAVIGVGLLRPGTAATGLGTGDVAPDFTLTSLEGKQVSLSEFRGKLVMLNFWYSTCLQDAWRKSLVCSAFTRHSRQRCCDSRRQ